MSVAVWKPKVYDGSATPLSGRWVFLTPFQRRKTGSDSWRDMKIIDPCIRATALVIPGMNKRIKDLRLISSKCRERW